MIVIDTDVLIDVSRGIVEAVDVLQRILEEDDPAISIITQMELIVGCRDQRELRSLQEFVKGFKVIKISELISEKASGASHSLSVVARAPSGGQPDRSLCSSPSGPSPVQEPEALPIYRGAEVVTLSERPHLIHL